LFFFFFIMVLRVPAFLLFGLWVLFQLFSGVGSLGVPTAGGVAYWAHLGGFAAGAALVAIALLGMRRSILGGREEPLYFPPEDTW
jgi:membrane associated rhomboid family serine protease